MDFFWLLLLAYLCGLAGSCLASARKIDELPPNAGILLLILLFQVITYLPLQIAKILVALTVAYSLSERPFLACGICFASGFALITFLPLLARIWQKLQPRLARVIQKVKAMFKS